MLFALLLAGSFDAASSQYKAVEPPDPAVVKRYQDSIVQAQAKGDLQRVRLDLDMLVLLYEDDPAMLASLYLQRSQVNTQLHDDARAAKDLAKAQALNAKTYGAPATSAPVYGGPSSAPPAYTPVAPQTTASPAPTQNKFSRFLNQASKVLEQAQQELQKQSAPKAPAGEPKNSPAGSLYPAAPDGAGPSTATPPAAQGSADASASAGVVVGYDANNQPIFASPQAAPGAAGGGQAQPVPAYPPPPPR